MVMVCGDCKSCCNSIIAKGSCTLLNTIGHFIRHVTILSAYVSLLPMASQ